jgi:prolyl-tRNA synthetase
VRGDRELNEHKARRALETGQATLADAATIERATGAPVGFAGPVGLRMPIYADQGLKGLRGAATGANKADTHLTGVDLERDAAVTAFHDLVVAREGDGCPRCGRTMREKRGIEVGHVFKLGTKYTDSFDAKYLDAAGARQPIVMGCYGIGVTRTLQSVIEQSHDANGIIWPLAVAPYPVVIAVMHTGHAPSVACAEALCKDLEQRGIDALLDDRDERPGVKFKDADLIGFPIRVVVGERSLEKNSVEIKLRTSADKELVNVADAAARIASLCGQ